MGIKALDVSLVRSCCMLIGSVILVLSMQVSIRIEPKDRFMLVIRSILGTICNVISVYGLSMVSLTATMTIVNTCPIWATILGCIFLSEGMSGFEIVALIVSFGSVMMIAFSKKSETNNEVRE